MARTHLPKRCFSAPDFCLGYWRAQANPVLGDLGQEDPLNHIYRVSPSIPDDPRMKFLGCLVGSTWQRNASNQCDKIGLFFETFRPYVFSKLSKISGNFCGSFENLPFSRNKWCCYVFDKFLEKFGYFQFQLLVTLQSTIIILMVDSYIHSLANGVGKFSQ